MTTAWFTDGLDEDNTSTLLIKKNIQAYTVHLLMQAHTQIQEQILARPRSRIQIAANIATLQPTQQKMFDQPTSHKPIGDASCKKKSKKKAIENLHKYQLTKEYSE